MEPKNETLDEVTLSEDQSVTQSVATNSEASPVVSSPISDMMKEIVTKPENGHVAKRTNPNCGITYQSVWKYQILMLFSLQLIAWNISHMP